MKDLNLLKLNWVERVSQFYRSLRRYWALRLKHQLIAFVRLKTGGRGPDVGGFGYVREAMSMELFEAIMEEELVLNYVFI